MSKNILSINRRVRRNKLLLRALFILFVTVFIVSGSVVGAFNSQKFKIKHIGVEGLSAISEEAVIETVESVLGEKLLALVIKDSYFLFSEKKMENILMDKFKRLKTVDVKKDFPESVLVTAVERKPEAILCETQEKSCLFIDDTGYIFERAPYFSSGVFLKFIDLRDEKPSYGNYLVNKSVYKKIVDFISQTGEFFKITKVYITNDGVYEFFTESGMKLIMEESDDWNFAFENLAVFMKETASEVTNNLEYIDLRFGKKVFYKHK